MQPKPSCWMIVRFISFSTPQEFAIDPRWLACNAPSAASVFRSSAQVRKAAVFAGLDQVNIRLTTALKGLGVADLVLTVDGIPSNTVSVNVR